MTNAELLTLINDEIAARLAGGAVDEWREGAHQVRHTPLDKLMAMRERYANFVEQEAGCAVSVVEVDLG